MRETLSRSTTTKSFSEYLVKISTQKFTLGSIAAGRGNGSLVSDDASRAAPKAKAIASAKTAKSFAIRLTDNFVPPNDRLHRASPRRRALPPGAFPQTRRSPATEQDQQHYPPSRSQSRNSL